MPSSCFLTPPGKNLPPLFWTRNGCFNPFQQKKAKKAEKNFQTEGRKIFFHKCLFNKITEIFFIPFLDVSGQNKAKKNFQREGRKKKTEKTSSLKARVHD